ncbi:hypothetical protein PILCRDRAFT_3869 [Piloderma croceum F 1598]|uniref:Protein kinase domain-containing protein n=1 Tax=Piloderma croceum (strain F 1598) TaxID=765440 RepID=A0A0C3CCH4_PILCF|nr:hypothetical protein PILCRDRAFT_3869 [Piloderma croceum F 1598]
MFVQQWSPATTLPELSLSTSSSTSSPRSATCSLSSSFSDVSPEALSTPPPVSKTHAFFSAPFSATLPSPPSAPPKSPSQASTRSLNNDFFASSPHSARPTPPPSLYTPSPAPSTPNSCDPSPPNQSSLKLRLPPFARLFPSRYNSDPTSWRSRDLRDPTTTTQREFVDLDPDATPHPQTNTELYFGDLSTKSRRVLEEDDDGDNYESPTESTPSPKDNFFKGVYAHALEAGTVIDGYSNEDGSISLSLIRALGRGAFSSVWLAQDISQADAGAYSHVGDGGRLVAVKVAPRDNHVTMLTFEREAEILRHISHPNIAPLLGSFSLPTRQILVLPYIVGGDLLDLVNSDSRHGQLTEGLLRRIVVELVGAVGWLHSGMGDHIAVVHRDIKLENILLTPSAFPSPSVDLTKPLIKLTDFGLSRMIDTADPLLSTRCGSEAYAAPELVVGRIASSSSNNGEQPWITRGWYDGREMDAWAVGVVIYALMCRALPFGEGVPVGGDDRIDRKIKARGRERERERERKSWLMRIAKGEYEWPSSLPPLLPPDNTNAEEEEEEPLRGIRLAHIPRVRKVVERLLVRDPKKRVTLKDLGDDEWLAVAGSSCVMPEGRFGNRDTIGPMAWQEIE